MHVQMYMYIQDVHVHAYKMYMYIYMYMYIVHVSSSVHVHVCIYSRRQKNVSIFFRRTVKVRSVPFPFYGAFYGKRTVKVR